uniref:Uncharacterized protein n=1 Tax=Rhodocyclus tenuis TaxID=1066 RepID=A0A840GAW0_RHOTE|nr:hypothetical protein [Rhodocyclus tenuis]
MYFLINFSYWKCSVSRGVESHVSLMRADLSFQLGIACVARVFALIGWASVVANDIISHLVS